MIQQKRYFITLSIILLLGMIVYIFLVPNFETVEFNQEVVDNIAEGVTTTIPGSQNNDNLKLKIILNYQLH